MVEMTEKALAWFRELPAWIPICGSLIFCALWIGQHYQSITDRLDTLEHQMKDVQEYLRNDHKKGMSEFPDSELQLPPAPQDAKIPPMR
jgi:hypothetical protein